MPFSNFTYDEIVAAIKLMKVEYQIELMNYISKFNKNEYKEVEISSQYASSDDEKIPAQEDEKDQAKKDHDQGPEKLEQQKDRPKKLAVIESMFKKKKPKKKDANKNTNKNANKKDVNNQQMQHEVPEIKAKAQGPEELERSDNTIYRFSDPVDYEVEDQAKKDPTQVLGSSNVTKAPVLKPGAFKSNLKKKKPKKKDIDQEKVAREKDIDEILNNLDLAKFKKEDDSKLSVNNQQLQQKVPQTKPKAKKYQDKGREKMSTYGSLDIACLFGGVDKIALDMGEHLDGFHEDLEERSKTSKFFLSSFETLFKKQRGFLLSKQAQVIEDELFALLRHIIFGSEYEDEICPNTSLILKNLAPFTFFSGGFSLMLLSWSFFSLFTLTKHYFPDKSKTTFIDVWDCLLLYCQIEESNINKAASFLKVDEQFADFTSRLSAALNQIHQLRQDSELKLSKQGQETIRKDMNDLLQLCFKALDFYKEQIHSRFNKEHMVPSVIQEEEKVPESDDMLEESNFNQPDFEIVDIKPLFDGI